MENTMNNELVDLLKSKYRIKWNDKKQVYTQDRKDNFKGKD